ncbi:hypothetical protein [Curtobacterium sp. TXMA1]|uniref:hypothetical protein n=1 Tax=Curtobacterium sp. TXMA1 TaxID=2876939 RepID=UPI001CCD30F7|nr:hypothetical protein [Curtobacterium sp. TXMA1]UBQ03631.1 hypothetical protein LCG91_05575 [Curtobacterium sp. TXMA1]
MSGKLEISYAALESLSSRIKGAATKVEPGNEIFAGQGATDLASDVVTQALSRATRQQVQRAELTADALRAAGNFPLAVRQAYTDADSRAAGALAK